MNNEEIIKVPKDFLDTHFIRAYEWVKDDRWQPFKEFLDHMGAKEGDSIAFEKIGNRTYYCYPLDLKKFKKLGIILDDKNYKEIYKELVSSLPNGENIEADHIIQVKSQRRCGPKKEFEKALESIGAEDNDILYFKKSIKNGGFAGWFVSLMKYKDLKDKIEIEVLENEI